MFKSMTVPSLKFVGPLEVPFSYFTILIWFEDLDNPVNNGKRINMPSPPSRMPCVRTIGTTIRSCPHLLLVPARLRQLPPKVSPPWYRAAPMCVAHRPILILCGLTRCFCIEGRSQSQFHPLCSPPSHNRAPCPPLPRSMLSMSHRRLAHTSSTTVTEGRHQATGALRSYPEAPSHRVIIPAISPP
jgi:hypothetical protein